MIKFIYYSTKWCAPCRKYWPKVQTWAMELGAEPTRVDLSDGPIDGILGVPTMDVVVDGELKLRVTQWGPGTRGQILEVLL